ncbi:g303 [Coccomyxa viridis]|uniref:G303 protein n=1 Tax=Coccomyxa viridis TaxID=1274662 RepID=A0ABP1FH06_9CHLO
MAGTLPDWAHTPKSKGWYVQTAAENAERTDIAADDNPGLFIGRNGQVCEIEVAHKSASRVHACIAYDESQQPFLVDLGSTHGTSRMVCSYVDGEALEKGGRRKLEPGRSVVTIGRCEMTIRLLRKQPATGHNRRGREAPNGKEEYRHASRSAHPDDRAAGQGQRPSHPCEQEQHPDHDRFSHSLGFDSRAAGREQERRDDRYPPHSSARGGGRGRGPGSVASYQGSRDDSWHEQDRPIKGPVPGRRYRGGQREERGLPRSDYQRGREHDTGRHAESRGRNGPPSGASRNDRPSRQPERHHDSSRAGKAEEAHRKRQSSDEDDKDAGERRQRQRKTGFQGPAVHKPAEQPTQTPAQIVRSMMGGGGPQAPMTLEQKKKLLWGKKPDPQEPAPSTAFGANRWDTAEFSNAGDKNKFIKLMGVKANPESLNPNSAIDGAQSPTTREALTKDKQDRLLQSVEQHFMTGLRRADGRTVGLGL